MIERLMDGQGRSWGGLALIVALALAPSMLGCNRIATEENGLEAGVLESRPAESDFESIGPETETRLYYQFIDGHGAVRFVERLVDVPELWRKSAGFVELPTPPPLSPMDARRSRNQVARGMNAGAAGQAKTSPTRILLYSADWCGFCQMARSHLARRRIPYELRDVDVPSAKAELIEKTGGKGIPVLDIDGRILKGYRKASMDSFLDEVGL